MTNWEKLREVFGISESNKIEPEGCVCDLVYCDKIESCVVCPIYKAKANAQYFWEREYNEESEEE